MDIACGCRKLSDCVFRPFTSFPNWPQVTLESFLFGHFKLFLSMTLTNCPSRAARRKSKGKNENILILCLFISRYFWLFENKQMVGENKMSKSIYYLLSSHYFRENIVKPLCHCFSLISTLIACILKAVTAQWEAFFSSIGEAFK